MISIQHRLINLINKRAILPTLCKSSYSHVDCLFNCRSQNMSFSSEQRVSIAEHYLASCSYQNEFRDKFPDSPMRNKSTIARLVNSFRDTWSLHDRNCSGRTSTLMHASLNAVDISNIWQNIFLLTDLNVLYFLTTKTCQELVTWHHPVCSYTKCFDVIEETTIFEM